MTDLRWDEHVARLLDPTDGGCLAEVFIEDTTVADWQALLDLVEEQGWAYEFIVGCFVLPLPRAEAVLSRPAGARCPVLCVRPAPEVCAVFRFLGAEQIGFDVGLGELQGQEQLDVLCGFLTAIGRRLGRPVPMYVEGDTGAPFLGYDAAADRVRALWAPPVD
ncbi:hypothetical protein ACFVVA_08365 [Kitasatospora sp. NPDC058048]|uniref:hypothetical protein n=1 Tax=Kitasatospora sp. NPDC058048 TaxID=3346313 RepID=UPI0036DD2D9D